MDLEPLASKVNSQELFLEFLAALLEEYTKHKERLADRASNVPSALDVTQFLRSLHLLIDLDCKAGDTLTPSWETFARLLLVTKGLHT
jgi:hypothetical protein